MARALDPDRPVRWGILGAGRIAETVGAELAGAQLAGAELGGAASPGNLVAPTAGRARQVAAVGARELDRAAGLAEKLGAPRAYGSYAELVDDPEIDAIYIATTHAQHHEHALLALRAGKPVLVEKAFALNARQARDIVATARARELFCMEAMWLRFNPLIRQAVEIAESGQLGDLLSVRADLSAYFAYDPRHRLFDLAAGGGALLDLGVYLSHFAWLLLGRPDSVQVTGALAPSGSDETAAMQWGYADGRFAQLACTTRARNPLTGFIAGTRGWISIGDRLHRPASITVSSDGGERVIRAPVSGYLPEFVEAERCLRAGLAESPLMNLDDTVGVLEILDEARAQLGVRYPADEDAAV